FGAYQSWTQEMRYHPHIHYIVPGVGLNTEDKPVHLKKSDFLVYAQPLSDLLRARLLNRLKDAGLIDTKLFWKLWKIDWVTDVMPVGNGSSAVKYTGQYIHHSVISDHRILGID